MPQYAISAGTPIDLQNARAAIHNPTHACWRSRFGIVGPFVLHRSYADESIDIIVGMTWECLFFKKVYIRLVALQHSKVGQARKHECTLTVSRRVPGYIQIRVVCFCVSARIPK
jgi:hypothetical protein